MQKILVSACLLGDPVRYDGKSKSLDNQLLEQLQQDNLVIKFCPEVAGGLATPRDPAEIIGTGGDAVLRGEAKLITDKGEDVSKQFIFGAQKALALCHSIKLQWP